MSAVMASPATAVRAGAGMRLLRAAVFTAVCVVLAAAGHTLASGRGVPGWSLAVGWVVVFAVAAPLAGRERSMPGIAGLLAVGQIALHSVFNVGQVCASVAAASAAGGASGTSGGGSGGGLMAVATRLVCAADGPRLTPATARQVVLNAGLDPSKLGVTHVGGSGMAGMSMPAGGTGAGAHAVMVMPLCSLPMLLGHLLAAVVAGWLLRRGESALWRLVRLSVRGASELPSLSVLAPAALRRAYALVSALAAGVPGGWLRIRAGADLAAGRHRTVWLRHSVARRGPPVGFATV
jgi:hypothetical protein